ncbi:MAG: ABC transporter ATP-binding protein [Betaproteobacteria bacterium]|nr:ABC transporter ATP-binding protein [Betaproteobacteria bacterium]MSQ88905.1 ABC transporter ATP-binding protein [Betaproteobacteria bacterium]
MSALLEIQDLHHRYHRHEAVCGLSFSLERGAIGCLLGPSGCGKTTVLRCIAGFETPSAGRILLNGTVVSSAQISLPPEKRRVGMVFQEHALFPHLSAARNIAFGISDQELAGERVQELATLTGITDLLQKYPHELSGGQQQRVALARALAPRPALLLLDEPFSNLDTDLRERLSQELREIIKASGATAVLVTHDQHEAFAMADEIGVVREGRIEQWDSAYNLYHRPANRFVADFVGQGVLLPAKVLNPKQIEIELGVLEGDIPHACQSGCQVCSKGCLAEVLLRPDDVIHDDAAPTQAEVVHKAFRGAEIMYTLKLASGRKVLALVPSHHNHALGERIGIRLDVDHVVAFAPQA